MGKINDFFARIFADNSNAQLGMPKYSRRARATSESGQQPIANSLYYFVKPEAGETWRVEDLDRETLDKITPQKLVEILTSLSPEISKALFDFIRLFNAGWEVTAYVPNTDKQSEAGQKIIDDFLLRLKALYGSVDTVIDKLIVGGWLRGAFFAEIVLDEDGRTAIDLATPDPYTVTFKRARDKVRGDTWLLGQYDGLQWIDLSNVPTVKYIPIDPLPNSPYGRSLVQPSVFASLFLLGLMHDLRRVVSQQGYPRIDIEVKMEELRNAMPASIANNPETFKAWVNEVIDEVSDIFRQLEPDDAYIHTDTIQVNKPVSALNTASLGSIDSLIRSIERMMTRALKTMPLLMGISESTTETHANRQWEIQAAGIKSLQHLLEGLLEHLLEVAVQAAGVRATVKWRFAELRASEAFRDAQTEALQIQNARAKYDAGWVSQDEAAEAITGHKADSPTPRVDNQQTSGALIQANPGDGSQRMMTRAVQISPEGSNDPLPPLPNDVEVTEDDTAWDSVMPKYAGLLDATTEE